jgi:hypothetical protein
MVDSVALRLLAIVLSTIGGLHTEFVFYRERVLISDLFPVGWFTKQ